MHNNLDTPTINQIRRQVVTEAFIEGIGHRAFIMTAEFPFVFIGPIMKVVGDFAYIDTETTSINALDGNVFRIHLDEISVFYIENGGPEIPSIC